MALTTSKRVLASCVRCISLFVLILALPVSIARAQTTSYDPYADSVATTTPVVTDPNNAVGAPNNTNASLVGVGASLTLDMGKNEEGLKTLRVYLGQINLQVNMTVDFLDANKAVIKTETRQLTADQNPRTEDFIYSWESFTKAYRLVRVSSPAGGGVNVDAVEALGYLGATAAQDTDNDGVSDRVEQEKGTNPLVADQPATTTPSTPTTATTPPTSTTTTTNRSTTRSSTTTQVNSAPAAGDDEDHDGMSDTWEKAHGLNPADPNDANADPDQDRLTNLGEYEQNTDPQVADNLKDVFCKGTMSPYWWLLPILILLALLVGAVWMKKRKNRGITDINSNETRSV